MADVKWIKMDVDIFNNRKIKQIEILPDGDSIIVIWVKLLCLAGNINDGGSIYLTEELPYTEQMLATQFNRPLATVQLALRTFEQFGMVEIIDDMLHISNWEKYQNVDRLNELREYNRLAQQKSRAKRKLLSDVNDKSMTSQSCQGTDKDKNKIKNKIKNKNNIKAQAPADYFPDDKELNDAFLAYIDMRKKIKAPMTTRAIELAIKKLIKLSDRFGVMDREVAIAILNESVMNSWKGLFEYKGNKTTNKDKSLDEVMKEWGL